MFGLHLDERQVGCQHDSQGGQGHHTESKLRIVNSYLLSISQTFYQSTLSIESVDECLSTLNLIDKKMTLKYISFLDQLHPDLIEYIFRLCHRLKLSNDQSLLTIDLAGKFYLHHLQQVEELLFRQTESPNGHEETISKIEREISLRLVTCAKIAHKVIGACEGRKFNQFLSDMNPNYSAQTINQSELRVLKVIDNQIPITSLATLVKAIIHLIGTNQPEPLEPGVFLMTKIVYLNWSSLSNWFERMIENYHGEG